VSSPRVLAKLGKRWDKLVANLRSADIAHGDLQHGNILVQSNGAIRLIDYDGMWVPALKGHKSNETGHPDFQNPHRTRNDFDLGIDDFSAAVIRIAILALRRDRSLWEKYNNGDNLLFRRRDFLDPHSSQLITDLKEIADNEIDEKLDFLIKACTGTKQASSHNRRDKAAARKLGVTKTSTNTVKSGSWLSDHVEDYGGQSENREIRLPPRSPAGIRERLIEWLRP